MNQGEKFGFKSRGSRKPLRVFSKGVARLLNKMKIIFAAIWECTLAEHE